MKFYNSIKKGIKSIIDFFKEEPEPQPWYDLYGNNIAPTIDYPECTIYELFKKAVDKYPLNTAYKYYGKKCLFLNFNHQIITAARALRKIGVKKKDVVTICMPNTPEAIIMFYAVNMVGAVACMIHPLSSEKEIEFYLRKTNSRYIQCLNLVYPKVAEAVKEFPVNKVIVSKASGHMPLYMKILYNLTQKQPKIEYKDLEDVVSFSKFYRSGETSIKNPEVPRLTHEDAVILFSGGTTGDPKAVVLTNMNFNAMALQAFKMVDPIKAGDSVLSIMPIFHGFGIGVCVHTILCGGACTILVPVFKANEFYKLIKQYKPNVLAGVPTLFEALINSKENSKTYMKNIHSVICGGDLLNPVLRDRVDKYLLEHGSKAKIRVGYGLTECVGASCITPRYYYKEGGIGIPCPDMLYQICKIDTNDKLPFDEVGEICISGPTVMSRYLNDVVATKNALHRHKDGRIWLHTGDLGYMTKDGLVFFKTRLKRMIVSSGYNIYPNYIEKVVTSHPAVLTSIVIGIPHPYKVEVPKAYIVLRENFDLTAELKEDIKKYCEKSLAKYELPYEYEYVDELPKTKVGKVAFTKLGKTESDK